MLSNVMMAPHFPVEYQEIHCRILYHEPCAEHYTLDTLNVSTIPLSHPNNGVGYRFEEAGKKFVFLTDNELDFPHPGGLPFDRYREFCAGADLLIHDAEFTPEDYMRTWGHSTFNQAVKLALEAGVKNWGSFITTRTGRTRILTPLNNRHGRSFTTEEGRWNALPSIKEWSSPSNVSPHAFLGLPSVSN